MNIQGLMRGRALCLAALLSVLLVGCGKTLMYLELLKPGSVTVEEVRQRHPPTREWLRPDGGRTFEYAEGETGVLSRRLDFGKDGLFLEWYRPATLERAEGVKRAMTRQNVLDILGEPNRRTRSSSTGGEVWEWVLGVRIEEFQRCIVVEWHPKADAVTKVYEDNYSL